MKRKNKGTRKSISRELGDSGSSQSRLPKSVLSFVLLFFFPFFFDSFFVMRDFFLQKHRKITQEKFVPSINVYNVTKLYESKTSLSTCLERNFSGLESWRQSLKYPGLSFSLMLAQILFCYFCWLWFKFQLIYNIFPDNTVQLING